MSVSPRLIAPLLFLFVLAVGALVMWRAQRVSSVGPGAAAAASPDAAIGADTPAQRAPASEAVDERAQLVTAEVAPPARVFDRERDLFGIVLDPQGKPVAGAAVEVLENEFVQQGLLDLAHRWERSSVAKAVTDARGEFAFPLPAGRPFTLEVAAQGFARARLDHRFAGERVEVVLDRGALIHGRVLRRADGSPVADAEVALPRKPDHLGSSTRGERVSTDGAGRFRFEDVQPGNYWLQVEPVHDASAGWLAIELHPGEVVEREVLVDAGVALRGRVTDALTHLPIAGAEIGQGWTFEKTVTTDAGGEYVFEGFPLDGYFDIGVRAPGYGRAERTVREDTQAAFPERLDVELQPARRVRGRIVDTAGQPVAGAYAAAPAYEYGDGTAQRIDFPGTRTGADGRFELADVRPDIPHALYARKPGYATIVHEFPTDELERAIVELGDVRLPPAATLRGVVVDDEGKPLADQFVSLRGANASRGQWNPARITMLDSYLAEREARTDDLGRFSFGDLAAGSYTVEAGAEGARAKAQLPVDIAEGATVADLRLVLAAGLAIAGRCLGPDGEPVAGYVSVDPEFESPNSADVRTDTQGRFVARGLAAGTYKVTLWPDSLWDGEPGEVRWAQAELAGVPAGAQDVQIAVRRALRIAGVVLDAQGRPARNAFVMPSQGANLSFWTARCDPEGRFELWLPEGELFDIEARASADGVDSRLVAESDQVELKSVRRTGIAPGGPELTLRLP